MSGERLGDTLERIQTEQAKPEGDRHRPNRYDLHMKK